MALYQTRDSVKATPQDFLFIRQINLLGQLERNVQDLKKIWKDKKQAYRSTSGIWRWLSLLWPSSHSCEEGLSPPTLGCEEDNILEHIYPKFVETQSFLCESVTSQKKFQRAGVFSLQAGLFDHTMVTNFKNAGLNHPKPGLGANEFTAISSTSQGASLEPLYLYFSTSG